MPSSPIEKFARPNSRTIGSAALLLISKICSAVKRGWKYWRKPARKSLIPTGQNTNHFPTSSNSGAVLCKTKCSTAIEPSGSANNNRKTIIGYARWNSLLVVSLLQRWDLLRRARRSWVEALHCTVYQRLYHLER